LLTHHHFDHTRDLVTLCFNNASLWRHEIQVYALQQALDVVIPCLLDGKIYLNLLESPSPEKPLLHLNTAEPYRKETIGGYEVLPLPVKHSVPTVGYQITSPDGKSFFYTGDTSIGIAHCWQYVSPNLLVTEVLGPNKFEDRLKDVGHLSANLLKQELIQFKQLKAYLPRVIAIHIGNPYEQQIKEEVALVAEELGADISLGYEDMEVTL
jgi:ribonuclease BN (tRNA processing enzyme)